MQRMVQRLFGFRKLLPSKDMIVLITGCDSGLGFRTALEAANAGLTVVAGFFEGPESKAARKMLTMCPSTHKPHLIHLDITSEKSISKMVNFIGDLLKTNSNYDLHAVVNNAGVMVFGDFEWQSSKLADFQLSVNVGGTWKVTRATLPMLRQSVKHMKHPRIITIGSHCSIQSLPTLTIYGATKSALSSWCDSLGMELRPHGIHVVHFIPGSMVQTTNIVSKQNFYFEEMKNSFDEERSKYYGEDLNLLSDNLSKLVSDKQPDSLDDSSMNKKLMSALLDESPKSEYLNQPLRYAFYHYLFKNTPKRIRHWLVEKFMMLPRPNNKNRCLK